MERTAAWEGLARATGVSGKGEDGAEVCEERAMALSLLSDWMAGCEGASLKFRRLSPLGKRRVLR